MRTIIKLRILGDDLDALYAHFKALLGLARGGLLGIYHPACLENETFICLSMPLQTINEDTLKSLNLLVQKETSKIKLTSVVNEPYSLEGLVPFTDGLIRFLNRSQKLLKGEYLKSIALSVVKSADAIKKRPAIDHKGVPALFSIPIPMPDFSTDPKKEYEDAIKIERNLLNAVNLIESAYDDKPGYRQVTKFFRKDSISPTKNSTKVNATNAIKLELDIKRQMGQYADPNRSAEIYYTDVTFFYKELAKMLNFHPSSIQYNPDTLQSATVEFEEYNVPLKLMLSFTLRIQDALFITGLMSHFSVHIIYLKLQDEILAAKKEVLNSLNIHEITDQSLNRALRIAAANNKEEEVYMLLSLPEVDVNTQDTNPKSKKTALHLAIERAHYAIIDTLIGHGALTDIKDANGMTAKSLAVKSEDKHIAAMLGVELLPINDPLIASSSSSSMRKV